MSLDEATYREMQETFAARQALLACRNGTGYWDGELASSALATATATFALQTVRAGAGDTSPKRKRGGCQRGSTHRCCPTWTSTFSSAAASIGSCKRSAPTAVGAIPLSA